MTHLWGSAACTCIMHDIKAGDMLARCHVCGGAISMPSPTGCATADCVVGLTGESDVAMTGRRREFRDGEELLDCSALVLKHGEELADCAAMSHGAGQESERKAIVAWLRAEAERNRWYPDEGTLLAAADAIEKGEHNK